MAKERKRTPVDEKKKEWGWEEQESRNNDEPRRNNSIRKELENKCHFLNTATKTDNHRKKENK